MARFTLVALAVLALSEGAPARAQFVIGGGYPFGYAGGYSYGYRSGFGLAFGGPRFRVSGFARFSGGFAAPGFGFAPFGTVGFVPPGAFGFGNPFWGGWGPGFGYGYGSGLGFGYGPPVVAVTVPVPVVVGAAGPGPDGDGSAGLPAAVRPGDFLVFAPKKEATAPAVTRVAPVLRPARPAIAFDPFKPAAAVKAEVPEADPKKEAARLVRLASESFAAGDYGRAAEHFERALAADPADPAVYFGHAQASFAAGHYAEAVARIRTGLALDPRWPTTAFDPAALYGDRPERFVVHLLALRKAAADNPNQATLEFLLGYELWFSGEKVEAAKLFRAAEKRLAAPGPIALFK